MDGNLHVIDRAAVPGPFDGRLGVRLIEQFFRRWPLYVLPLALCAALGVVSAARTEPEYRSVASLSASANPLVDQVEVRGNTINQFETPATGTARLINERLATDVFVDDVAERAGLSEALANDTIDRDVIRTQVATGVRGENVLEVSAVWGDPETAFLLASSTVDAYIEYVLDVVSQDSTEAIDLLNDNRSALQQRVTETTTALQEYLRLNPAPLDPDIEQPLDQQFEAQRLNEAVTTASAALQEVESQIATAELTAERAQSSAGRQFRIVDPAVVPTEAQPVRVKQLISVMMFTILGALIAATAVAVVTVLDSTVRLRSQIADLVDTNVITVVPKLRKKVLAGDTPSKVAS